ncbi:aspartic proteinase nepenthesin-2 [Phtheirospermum japonicum]|uniref:Aspartic proteinase nepenthesin-2 n=1 Tax=Phtheirospermum japonicum TaxID=374723 RepID=A0A830DAG1_9LAMI|nr:aspartic proteinase nepenthesin-2 [Phtheirospermum japonicum]
MATLNCFSLLTTFLIYSSLLLVLFSYFPEKSVALGSHFETIEITSLLTAPDCRRSFTGTIILHQNSRLEVFHRYGPCSNPGAGSPYNMPSAHDILQQDQLRVQSLQARFKPNSKKQNSQFQDTKEANLPVQFSPGDYTVNVDIGTPGQQLTLIFDTGSDLIWTRCSDTLSSSGINFNASASSSFSTIPCHNSSICTELLPIHMCNEFYSTNDTCFYGLQYGDGSYSIGAFSMESLNVTQTGDVFPNFLFGCAQEIEDDAYSDVAGMLGLGRDTISFVSQTEETYRGVFSYCFPSTPSSTGFLKLGQKDHYPNDVKFTPLITNSKHPSFYFIHIISISVGGVQLLIDQSYLDYPGTIIDSGTVITRLSMYVYTTMRDEFQKQMNDSGYQLATDAVSLLDTCYDTSNHETITVPTISFTLNGNVTVDLNSSTTLYAIDPTLACLAFAGNSDHKDLSIFGNTQQKTFEVMYDVDGGKLGFFPNGCH